MTKMQGDDQGEPTTKERWYGHIIGYCSKGPLYARPPAPYRSCAVCNEGLLGGHMTAKRPYNKKPKKD